MPRATMASRKNRADVLQLFNFLAEPFQSRPRNPQAAAARLGALVMAVLGPDFARFLQA